MEQEVIKNREENLYINFAGSMLGFCNNTFSIFAIFGLVLEVQLKDIRIQNREQKKL